MHEYSVAEHISGILETVSKEHGRRIVSALVAVGPLSMVVPELLYEAWQAVTAATVLEGVELGIEHVPIRAKCEDCGAETESLSPFVKCSECGSMRLKLMSGHELHVISAELVDDACEGEALPSSDEEADVDEG